MATDKKVLLHAIETMKQGAEASWGLAAAFFGIFFWIMLLRKWLLPCLLIAAVVVQTITAELAVQEVLLNGLAVCFIMEVHHVSIYGNNH